MNKTLLMILSLGLLAFRPYHFSESMTGWTSVDWGSPPTWTQTGSELQATGGAGAQAIYVRDTDASIDSDVQVRMRSLFIGANAAHSGPVCNYQNTANFYVAQLRAFDAELRIQTQSGGSWFTEASKSYTWTANTFYNIRITSADNGANKDLECFVDGTSELTVTTSRKHGSGQAGVLAYLFTASAQGDFEWFAFDLSLGATSISPDMGRHSGAQSVTITGTSFGDEMQLGMDGLAATNIVSEPTTIITGDTPATFAGPYGVVVGFGTTGSAEYAVTIANGFTYRLMGGLGTTGGGF